MGYGSDTGIADEYFVDAPGSGVSLISRLNIAFQQAPYTRQLPGKGLGNGSRLFAVRIA
jgi:hypothetical protein